MCMIIWLFSAALYPKFDVKLFRLERYKGAFAAMTLLSEIGCIAYTIFFLVVEIIQMKKQKKEYFKVIYLYDVPFTFTIRYKYSAKAVVSA